jgi:prevent-host-death family protein
MLFNIYQAKTQLSKLIEKTLQGEDVVIGKNGKPVVRLVAYRPKKTSRQPGLLKDKIIIKKGFDQEDKTINKMFYRL